MPGYQEIESDVLFFVHILVFGSNGGRQLKGWERNNTGRGIVIVLATTLSELRPEYVRFAIVIILLNCWCLFSLHATMVRLWRARLDLSRVFYLSVRRSNCDYPTSISPRRGWSTELYIAGGYHFRPARNPLILYFLEYDPPRNKKGTKHKYRECGAATLTPKRW